jgi:hypothetical protein
MFFKNPACGFYAVHARHGNVHQDYIRITLVRQRNSLFACGSLTHDLKIMFGLEQGAHTKAKNRMVVSDENADCFHSSAL